MGALARHPFAAGMALFLTYVVVASAGTGLFGSLSSPDVGSPAPERSASPLGSQVVALGSGPRHPAADGCPNDYDYGNGTSLDLQTTVDCANYAGFTGDLEITFVSMAYQESGFCPGAIESGSGSCSDTSPGCGSSDPDAEGILQEGTAGQCPPSGGSFAVGSYSASSCSTWSGSSSDWGGIYFNPQCSFQWALAYYNANGYAFWGSYLSGAYCQWAPTGYPGTGSELCDSADGYPSGGENAASLPWSTVCPGDNCTGSGGTPLSASYSMKDLATGASLTCGGTFVAGNLIQFNATATGGSGKYPYYNWTFGDGKSGTGVSVTHVYLSKATVNPLLTVTDSNKSTASTGSGCDFTVTASPSLAITSFVIAPSTVLVGSTARLTTTVTGGISPYAYAYSGLPPGCITSSLASLNCTPTVGGSYTVKVTVTDQNGTTASATALLAVTSPPGRYLATFSETGLPASTRWSVTINGSLDSTTNASEGVLLPNGTYAFTVGAVTGYQASPPNGTVMVIGAGPKVPITFTAVANTSLVSVSIVPFVNALISNQSRWFNASATCAPRACPVSVAFAWSFNNSLATLAPSNSTSTRVTAGPVLGKTNLTLVASLGNQSAMFYMPVSIIYRDTGPTITSFTASPSAVAVGGVAYLNVSVTGGTGAGTYTFAYQGLPSGCSSANTSSLACSPASVGNFTPTVKVSDRGNGTAAGTTVLRVFSAPNILIIEAFTTSPSSIPLGGTAFLNVTAAGGEAPYSYAYSGLPPGCTSSDSARVTCQPSVAGQYTIEIVVTDALADQAVGTAQLQVSAPAGYPSVGLSLDPGNITLGASVDLETTVSGGVAPYSLHYSGLPSGCETINESSWSCTPTESGRFSVLVAVTDHDGHTVDAGAPLYVLAPVNPLDILSFTASPTQTPKVNETLTLNVSATGGEMPYRYAYVGLPPGCLSENSSSLTCTPSVGGHYDVIVWVNDSDDHSANATLVLAVSTPGGQGNTQGSASPDWLLYGLIAALVAGIAVVAAVLIVQRRDRRPPLGTTNYPQGNIPWQPPPQ